MTSSQKARSKKMELIDAYVNEVGLRLPQKQHADLEREIRSMIEDTLEDESRAQGRPADEAMLVGVLKKLGPPQKMADSYLPPLYLIGPQLFPAYLMVLRIALAVILVTAVIGAGLSVALSTGPSAQVATALLNSMGGLITSLFMTLGVITFIFAIIQWAVPSSKFARVEKDWDPLKLKEKLAEDQVKPTKLIGEVIGLVIALVFINIFVQYVGIGAVHNGQWQFVQIFSPAFYAYIPWISLVWVAQTVLGIVVAMRLRWTPTTRWISVAIHLFSVGLAYIMLTGPSLVDLSPEKLSAILNGVSLTTQQEFATLIDAAVRLSLAIVIIVGIISLAVELYRLLLKGHLPLLRIPRTG
jgi:hypothetical protein